MLHAALGDGVGRKRGDGQQRIDRRHVDDDPATALRDHLFRCGLHTEECALQVDRNDLVEILFGNLEQILIPCDAGIVDHDVDPAKLLYCGRHGTIDIGAFCNIRLDRSHLIGSAEFGCRPCQTGGIDV